MHCNLRTILFFKWNLRKVEILSAILVSSCPPWIQRPINTRERRLTQWWGINVWYSKENGLPGPFSQNSGLAVEQRQQ